MSQDNSAIALQVLIHEEGDQLVENDQGRGPSKYGITLKTAQEFYPDWDRGNIESLTEEQAKQFYLEHFWLRYHLNLINDQKLATRMLGLVVNVGPVAVQWLQRAAGVDDDGIIGSKTATAVNLMPPDDVLQSVIQQGSAYYQKIAEIYPEKQKYLTGWLARIRS